MREQRAFGRGLCQVGRLLSSAKIGAHPIPNDENDVTRIRGRHGCHCYHRGGLTRQSRDYDYKEFSEAGFQQRDFRLKAATCHPERMRGTSHWLITPTSLKNSDQLRSPSVRAGLALSTRLGLTECMLHVSLRAEVVACQRRTDR